MLTLLSACGGSLPAPCAPAGVDFAPYVEPTACWFDTPDEATVDCGTLHVAEVEGDPQACRLAIAWARLSPAHGDASAQPVFLLGGGPGTSLLSRMDDVVSRLSEAAPGRVVIAHDPRGVGYSSPALSCTHSAIFEPGPISSNAEWLARCAAYHRAGGHDLDQYRSRVLAQDVVTLADALQVDQFSLIGVSFGSKLAQTIVRAHPERVSAVVLDAATPLETPLFEGPAHAARRALDELFAACAVDEQCTAQQGDLAAAFERTSERLRNAPARITVDEKTVEYDASSFVQAVLRLLQDGTLIPAAPAFIREIERGEYESAELLLAPVAGQNTEWLMNSAVLCAEELPWNTRDRAAADLSSFPDYAAGSNYDGLHARCAAVSVTTEPASIKAPLHAEVPLLAITGRFDPLARNQFWQEFPERFPRGTLLDFPDSGHGVLRHPCGQAVIAAFLDSPSTWRTPACYEDLQPPTFVAASAPLIGERLQPVKP